MSASDPTASSLPAPAPERPTSARRAAHELGWRGPLLLGCVALAALAYRGALAVGETAPQSGPEAESFLFEPTASSPTLVFAATIWMLARRWHRLRAVLGAPPRLAAGGLLLAGSLALALWSWKVAVPDFLLPSLTLWILGAALWLGGNAALRVLWLPALFVLFAYPLPLVLVNQIIYPLQLAVTAAAAGLLDLLGFQVGRVGDRVAFSGSVFQVIESCSGMRGTATIVMASVLYVELFHESRLRSALIVAGAPLIGLFTNQLRVLSIMFNPYSQIAAVHSAQGLLMIVVAVLLLAVWDALLARLLPAPAPSPPRRLPPRTPLPAIRLALLSGVTVALAAASLTVEPWKPPRPWAQPLSAIQVRDLGDVESLPIDKQFLGSTAFSEWVHRAYGEGIERVTLFLGGDDRSSGGLRMLSHKTAVLESAWDIEEQGRGRLASGREIDWLVLRSGPRRQLVWRWHEGTAGRGEETLRALLATERSPLRREGRAVVVRLATPIGDGLMDREAAVRRLEGLAAQVEGQLERILAPPA